jgi:hypothetical protein
LFHAGWLMPANSSENGSRDTKRTSAQHIARYGRAKRHLMGRTEDLGVDLRVDLRRRASDACEEEHKGAHDHGH